MLLIIALSLFLTSGGATAQEERVLHSFGTNQGAPSSGLARDAAGNLYGVTSLGGAHGHGTVYELALAAGGGWTSKVLHSFDNNGSDGYSPLAGLVVDSEGNIYGTTFAGGIYGAGTVFELHPMAEGKWAEKVLHDFDGDGTDGTDPHASLVMDSFGNLYGTTPSGGVSNCGTVFELTRNEHWTETVLYNFSNNGTDGTAPYAALVFDASGDLYGTTEVGGAQNEGTAFKLTPTAGGGWTESLLHNFGSTPLDGQFPNAPLVLDGEGNLYGTTSFGGANTWGTVFGLTPATGGGWTETTLHNFGDDGTDGEGPNFAGVIFDASGNLYGTTTLGGAYDHGTAFELTLAGGGVWTETILYSFDNVNRNADNPQSGLIFGLSGNLFGTTSTGGIYGGGTVFEIAH